jgi:hypothetical protein
MRHLLVRGHQILIRAIWPTSAIPAEIVPFTLWCARKLQLDEATRSDHHVWLRRRGLARDAAGDSQHGSGDKLGYVAEVEAVLRGRMPRLCIGITSDVP